MEWEPIRKSLSALQIQPNVADYERVYREFTWEKIICGLEGLPDGRGVNIAYEAVDRHAHSAKRNHLAL